MASAQFSSPSVELTTSSPQAHVVQMASPQPRHPSRHILENKSTLSLCPILFYFGFDYLFYFWIGSCAKC